MTGPDTTDEELLERWPEIRLDADNAAYYAGLLRRELVLNRCVACGWWHHPPRSICPRCWSSDLAPAAVAGRGTIALITRRGMRGDGPPPRPVVAVQLAEQAGLRVSGELVDTGPDIGDDRGGEVEAAGAALGRAVELDWTERDGRPWPVWRLSR